MKIVHICLGAFYPDGYSYQENMLPKFHKKLGYDVFVVAGLDVFDENGKIKWLPEGQEYVDDVGIQICRLNLKGNKKIAKKLKNYSGLYKILLRIDPDIIFVHNCQFICINELVTYLKNKENVVCYVDNHADFSNSATNWASRKILHGILWKHCAQAIQPYVKKFYGVLPARVDFLKEVYKLPEKKCELLVMGADDEMVEMTDNEEVKKQVRRDYNIADDDFLVITGGKIDAFKKQTLLLMDAVNSINSDKIKLIVFGSVTPDLKDDVEKRCSNKVKYIGWQKATYSYYLFAASDLVVFPGRHSVFWEQVVAQGIPMVCKYWNGTDHVDVGGNVIFLTKDNASEIQEKIEYLLANPLEYEKMKFIAKNKGMKVFSYKEISKRAIEV